MGGSEMTPSIGLAMMKRTEVEKHKGVMTYKQNTQMPFIFIRIPKQGQP